jgi:hypothetical protein
MADETKETTGHFLETCHAACQEDADCEMFAYTNADGGEDEGTCKLYNAGACTESVTPVTGADLYAR